jgi:hypothetical protein
MSNFIIYTSKGQLVVECLLPCGGVRRDVKAKGGECVHLFKASGAKEFRKTGWGEKAKSAFAIALAQAQAALRNA